MGSGLKVDGRKNLTTMIVKVAYPFGQVKDYQIGYFLLTWEAGFNIGFFSKLVVIEGRKMTMRNKRSMTMLSKTRGLVLSGKWVVLRSGLFSLISNALTFQNFSRVLD